MRHWKHAQHRVGGDVAYLVQDPGELDGTDGRVPGALQLEGIVLQTVVSVDDPQVEGDLCRVVELVDQTHHERELHRGLAELVRRGELRSALMSPRGHQPRQQMRRVARLCLRLGVEELALEHLVDHAPKAREEFVELPGDPVKGVPAFQGQLRGLVRRGGQDGEPVLHLGDRRGLAELGRLGQAGTDLLRELGHRGRPTGWSTVQRCISRSSSPAHGNAMCPWRLYSPPDQYSPGSSQRVRRSST
ncbi:hypothetical protein [Streptomyces sp. NPDC048192]|uniref:hypothetical protein n=1 Tax=Streptomyces sp. NPDC048192 TaxID=3365510 RepID=UPI00371CD5AC